jgi:hypothetical protein
VDDSLLRRGSVNTAINHHNQLRDPGPDEIDQSKHLKHFNSVEARLVPTNSTYDTLDTPLAA